jgi:hypothetical protein
MRITHTMVGSCDGWRRARGQPRQDGHKEGYDHSKTKDVNESGSGKHGKDDKSDRDDK